MTQPEGCGYIIFFKGEIFMAEEEKKKGGFFQAIRRLRSLFMEWLLMTQPGLR